MNSNIPPPTTARAHTLLPFALLLFHAAACLAQTPPATGTNQAAPDGYVCVQRGPNSKVWQRSLLFTNAAGAVSTNSQSYTELATGISYLVNGAYVDSVEEIDPVPGGAQAVQGRCQVQWALNANTPGGAVTVATADGKQLSSTVFGLAYYDVATGSNAAIGGLKNCAGAIVAPNQVLYANAFSNVTAGLLYTYTKAGLSQDIVLDQSPPPPDAYGLSDQSTILQVYTQFFTPPQPAITAVTNGNETDCQVLDFGDMKMGVGQTLFLDGQDAPIPAGSVAKQWVQINNSTYLIESIPYSSISNQLGQLPHASNLKPNRASIRGLAFQNLNPAPPKRPARATPPMKLARLETAKPRLKIDYDLLSSSNNLTLQGDSTYFVSSAVNITGTTTIEGGTVVKYTNSSSAEIITTNIVCLTGPYRPGVFTSMNDNSVGSIISGSTGAPSQGSSIYLDATIEASQFLTVTNLRFSYANEGICANTVPSARGIEVWDCQFFNCGTALYLNNTLCPFPVYIYNVLVSEASYALNANTDGCLDISAINVTADQVGRFQDGFGNTCSATNCIFTSVTNLSGVTNVSCCTNASSNGVYQTVGAGGYYLANGSSNYNAGTANIPTALLEDLETLTTVPPVVTNGWITNNCTLFPQVPRNNTGFPDRGYHYSPIDYAMNVELSNATVTVLPGTVLAAYTVSNTDTFGVYLYSNGIFNCQGTATSPNYIVEYNTVQEQSNPNWVQTNAFALFLTSDSADSSSANFAFTDWDLLTTNNYQIQSYVSTPLALQNCQFYGGWINGQGLALSASNCLFWRVNTEYTDLNQGNVSIPFYNNLFWQGQLAIGHFESGLYAFRDNFLVQTPYTVITNRRYPNDPIDICSNNAYVTTNFGVLSPTNGEVILSSSPAFQTGALGAYYYPSSLTNLIHTGSQSAAAAGLYFYTVLTNANSMEGTNTVSIGFHYVATDGYGVPLGGEDGGVPDYLQDPSGNGVLNPFLIFDQAQFPNEPEVRLGYWKFNNTSNWTNEAGLYPTSSNDLSGAPDWSSNALVVTNTTNILVYPVTENGANYFNPSNGTVRFWFKSLWGTGSNAPASTVTFFQMGNDWGGDPADQNWALSAAPQAIASVSNNITNYTTNVVLNFYTSSSPYDYYHFGWGTQPMLDLQAGLWYQMCLAYSPSNVAFYTNGVLFGASGWYWPEIYTNSVSTPLFDLGDGIDFYPPSAAQANGFAVGNQNNGGEPAMGQFDELETFNYPLTAQQVAWGFPTFGANPTNMVDTYYVGRSDMLQTYVDGVPPSSTNTSVVQCRLGYWRFDSPLLYTEQGEMPLSTNNVSLTPSWSGTALGIGSAANSEVTYPDVGSNGWANINCRLGSLRFWFKPNGTPAAYPAPFIYMGSTNGTDEWTLELTSSNTINFVTQTNNLGPQTILSASSSCLSTSHWTQIVLNYGPLSCSLWTNGVLADHTTGAMGNTNFPRLSYRQLGMVIGNNMSNNCSINGQFEEMETFNQQVSDMSTFQTVSNVDSDLDGIPDLLEDIHLTTARPFLGQPVVITGTIEAEQFDMGSNTVGYSTTNTALNTVYRPTKMIISPCTDLGGGYCLDQMHSNDWTQYTINVLVPQWYVVDVRAEAIGTNTNGVFLCEFTNAYSNSTAPFYTNTGPMTNSSTNWTDITHVLYLTNGLTAMKLVCSNNAPGATSVGRFNYISIYPYLPTPNVGDNPSSHVTLYPGTNYATALSNAVNIQNAVNGLGSIGGIVWITNGTFMVAQAYPDEMQDAWYNAGVGITNSNVKIIGAGASNTVLIAYNRATTVFSLGLNYQGIPAQCSNFTLQNMTIEAQPHRQVSDVTNTIYQAAQLPASGEGLDTGALTIFYGYGANNYAYNILVTNCQFLSADRSIVMPYYVSNVMVQGCSFIPDGLTDTFGIYNVYTGQTGIEYEVGIEVRTGASYNIVVLSNTYDGNVLISTPITNTAVPISAGGMVNMTNNGQWFAPDGLVYFQQAGNAFIARNLITNNQLEAVQLNAGPASVVGNTFYTLVNVPPCCALAGELSNPGIPATGSADDSLTFIGNWVYGDRQGLRGGDNQYPTVANVSGNWLNLSPISPGYVNDSGPGAAAGIVLYQTLNVLGNELVGGGRGVEIESGNTNLLVMNNNFGAATYGSIGSVFSLESITSAQIFSNILGEGVTFHAALPCTNTFGWFLGTNKYVTTNGTAVPLFTDPASCAMHIFN